MKKVHSGARACSLATNGTQEPPIVHLVKMVMVILVIFDFNINYHVIEPLIEHK
jgi:hypothetical protein